MVCDFIVITTHIIHQIIIIQHIFKVGNICNTERRGRARGRGTGPAREPVVAARNDAPAATDNDGEVSFKEASSLAPARRSERPKHGSVTFNMSPASEPTVAFKTASAPGDGRPHLGMAAPSCKNIRNSISVDGRTGSVFV